MRKPLSPFVAVGIAACLTSSLARVQTPAPGSTDAIPETSPADAAPATDVSRGAGSLSDKLSSTDGVIHPEGSVDPGIQKPAPSTGSMPVIRPPGSTGDGSDVQPK